MPLLSFRVEMLSELELEPVLISPVALIDPKLGDLEWIR